MIGVHRLLRAVGGRRGARGGGRAFVHGYFYMTMERLGPRFAEKELLRARPRLLRQRSHARRAEQVPRPQFPCCLFVLATTGLRWRSLLTRHSERTVVRTEDGGANIVHDSVITGLRGGEVDGAIVRRPHPYRVGQAVRISAGHFDGFIICPISTSSRRSAPSGRNPTRLPAESVLHGDEL